MTSMYVIYHPFSSCAYWACHSNALLSSSLWKIIFWSKMLDFFRLRSLQSLACLCVATVCGVTIHLNFEQFADAAFVLAQICPVTLLQF